MKIVLHICCGVCAASVVEKLTLEGHEIFGLFYNPNIYPQEEYNKRLEASRKVAKQLNFPLEEGPYTPQKWFEETIYMENEPEGSKRCEICFRLRLKETYLYSKDYGGDAFTTTLTISPRKSADMINQVGRKISRSRFLVRDFKKGSGFQRATELSKQWDLYRQHYCGCIYSMRRIRK
ncbi:epoxyqueuosine reductase QueH [Chloroflexota bacterium]